VAQLSTLGHLHAMRISRYLFSVLFAVSVLAAGCASQPSPDPLAGWNVLLSQDSEKLNQSITNDYRAYIQTLPPEERQFVSESNIWILEDGKGQHAISIKLPLNGTWWAHVLIYDQSNKRVKTMLVSEGRYQS
jgi:hypothetical protein